MSFNPQYKSTLPTLTNGQFTTGIVDENGRLLVETGVDENIYSATLKSYAGYATPTDMIMIQGSATKTIRILGFTVRIGTTSAAIQRLDWVRRSAANTGGTKAVIPSVTLDSTSPAATAVVEQYSVIPASLGSGTIIASTYTVTTVLTSAPSPFSMYSYLLGVTSSERGVVLRGTSEFLCANWGGAALPAGFLAQAEVTWREY
jgi:hypothetical protein